MTRIYQLLTLIAVSVLSVWVLLSFTSCKQTKEIQVQKVEVTIHDTLRINGRDSIIEKTIFIECPPIEAPKTRKELRHERKSWHHEYKMLKEKNAFTIDSLNKVIKLSRVQKNVRRIEAKQVIKQTKVLNQKTFKWYHWVLISIGGIILLFIGFLIGKYLSKLL